MNFFSNPIVMCGSIALGIIFLLVLVVVICCKMSSNRERQELKELSQEIETDFTEQVVSSDDDKIENVLSKMQEALDTKEQTSISFEQEQEENAIISYQELLNSLGAKSSIDIDSIELYDDELENQVEISDFNKEIIDAYQNENLEKEFYRFQNDYSSEGLAEAVMEEGPTMNFDFSANFEYVDEQPDEIYEVKNNVVEGSKKFKRTEFISPIYGIIDDNNVSFSKVDEDVEKIDFEDNDSLLDEF